MSLFPKIQSPCPYKGKFADIMEGNSCRLCKRDVIDLTDMSDTERQSFLAACDQEVCVSYRVGAKSALAALAMGTVAVPSAAAAQDQEAPVEEEGEALFEGEPMYIIVGGMKNPSEAEWVSDEPIAVLDELPVEYDDAEDESDKDEELSEPPPLGKSPLDKAPMEKVIEIKKGMPTD